MKRNRYLAIAGVVLASATASAAPQRPSPELGAVLVAMSTADHAAAIYANLPACGGDLTKKCSDTATVAALRPLYAAAAAAVAAARAAPETDAVSTAKAAVQRFQAAIPSQ